MLSKELFLVYKIKLKYQGDNQNKTRPHLFLVSPNSRITVYVSNHSVKKVITPNITILFFKKKNILQAKINQTMIL